jgi:bilirubin oxidase
MLENNIKLLFWVAIVGLLQNAPITAQSFTNPLLIPPTMSGTTFNLSIAASTKQFTSGINTPTFGINGNYLAPTLVFQKGDVVNMNVSNNISEETTLHWHGLHVPSETDGSPHNIIAPNSTWAVHFQIKNAASTNWYHPHPHQNTVTHVTKGLAGMIIVHDNIESQLNLPRTYGTDDLPIILQDRSFSGSDLVTTGTSAALSDLMTVNGTLSPFVDCPAQVVRLRVLNGSNARVYNLGFNDNRSFQVIASDGGLLAQPFSTTRLVIANGERYEILVNLSADLNQDLYLKSYGNELAASVPGGGTGMMNGTSPLNAASFDMLRFHVVAATANPITTIPSVLTTVTPINPAMANVTRVKTLAGNGMVAMGNFTINGRQFDINYVNDVVNLNDTEIWEINNTTNIAHPFHIHDVQFYVLSRNGSAPPAYESALKDVVLVNSGETVRFIAKFEDFASTTPYMYHCHNLLHEDGGMMGQFVVSAPTIPVELVDFSAKKQVQDALLS